MGSELDMTERLNNNNRHARFKTSVRRSDACTLGWGWQKLYVSAVQNRSGWMDRNNRWWMACEFVGENSENA